jgi:LacI family transcriptional regulator
MDNSLKKNRRSSIQEVSQLSGVSVATVSRVIHNNGRFSPETEKRVREVMQRLNYVPDMVAQGMRTRFMPIIGIILPDIMDENYALMVRTIQSALFTSGYSTVVCNSNEDSALSQQFINTMKVQRASGLVYVPDSHGEDVDPEGMPIIYFDRLPKGEQPSNSVIVAQDNFSSAKNAVSRLIASGRQNIALLSDKLGVSSHQERIRGYQAALEEAGCKAGPAYLVDPQRTSEAISMMNGVLESGIHFDSIFCTSIRLTIGALTVLHKANIPESEVSVLGFGEHRLHIYGLLQYIAIPEPIVEMAVTAARQLSNLISGKAPENSRIVLP